MNKVDKQALREAAINVRIAGEAPFMSFDQRIDALNAFTKLLTPATAIALLDENEELEQRIAELEAEQSNSEIMAQGVEKLITEDFAASIAGCLSDFDGMDEERLNQLIWSGNPPEPEGDVWCVEYMRRAYSIQGIIKNFAKNLREAKS